MIIDYFNVTDAISNSRLSTINPEQAGHPKNYLSFPLREKTESLSLERGTLVHSYVEHPESFIVADIIKPTGQMGNFIDFYYKHCKQTDEISARNQAYALAGFKRDKIESVWTKFQLKENQDYFEHLNKADGKIVMTKQTKFIVDNCIKSLRSHLVAPSFLFTGDKGEALSELEVYWEEELFGIKHKLKAKLDRLLIDWENKLIILVDLKTTGDPVSKFPKGSFEFYQYYRQIAFYKRAIRMWASAQGINIKGFTFEAYIIAVETGYGFNTEIFKISKETILRGETTYMNLIERLSWHMQINFWEMPRESFEKGYILI